MTEAWIGKSVSIKCIENLGVFQGIIKNVHMAKITISNAFRNGIPLKKEFMEITIASCDIEKLALIPTFTGPILPLNKQAEEVAALSNDVDDPRLSNKNYQNNENSVAVEMRQSRATKSPAHAKYFVKTISKVNNSVYENGSSKSTSKPIEINGLKMAVVPFKNDKRKQRKFLSKNNTFGTPVDDAAMCEDFDFEKNLALFDKQAIWDEIDSIQKPDLVRQTVYAQNRKYRHDENVITAAPTQYRQIEVEYENCQEYVTDEGLVIPSIPRNTRSKIQSLAEENGLAMERQCDTLARGAAELALQLLGGARRLTPNNQHQWPKIVIICDEPFNHRMSEIGLSTGRHLASHGLQVTVYVSCSPQADRVSHELKLYAATGNPFTFNVNALLSSDLVIAAVRSKCLNNNLKKWILENRAPVFAIDPPVSGIDDVPIKCSILPILPLDDVSVSACGKLYLCNLGVPDKFFHDSGIKYKSPFDKFVIPIHRQD